MDSQVKVDLKDDIKTENVATIATITKLNGLSLDGKQSGVKF